MRYLLSLLLVLVVPPRAEDVSWITGCWEGGRGERTFREQWLAAPGGSLIGVAESLRGGNVVDFETTRIFERGDTLVYLAQPSGQPHAEFKASAAGDSVIFANPSHDFPQRVIYVKGGQDSLWARIEGTMNGASRAVAYRFARVECQSEKADEARVLALDSLWAHTYAVHDTATALQLFDEQIVITNTRGKKDRAGELNDVRAQPGLQVHFFRSRPDNARVMRDAALVTGLLEWSITYNGRKSDTRRAYGTVYRRGGPLGWRMVAMHIAPAP